MTRIIGNIGKSAQTPLNGIIKITLDSTIFDDSTNPSKMLFPVPEEFDFENGVIDLDLVSSEEENVSYHFELFTVDNQTTYYLANSSDIYTGATHQHTDGRYYTGLTHTSDSVLLDTITTAVRTKFDDFHTIIPNVAEIKFRELVPQGVAVGGAEQGLHRIARILATNTQYKAALRGGGEYRGIFNPSQFYKQEDWVYHDGGSYTYINFVPSKGNYPIPNVVTGYWGPMAGRGATGAGTTGNNSAYDPNIWTGKTDAPSRGAVSGIIEQLARRSELAAYVRYDNPNFTNGANVKTPEPGSLGTSVVNLEVLQGYLPKINPKLEGLPSTTTPLLGDRTQRVANTEWTGATIAAELAARITDEVQRGSSVVALNSAGEAVINFPRNFQRQPLIIICNGDWAGNSIVSLSLILTPDQRSGFTIKGVGTGGTLPAGTLVRVNWFATGLIPT